jgi:flagellar assembly protein FliH
VEALREAAYDEGFAAGVAHAQEQLSGPASALAAAVAQLQAIRADAADSIEADAVDLGLRIAEQALAAAMAVDRERVVDVVRGALRATVERERVTIQLNPADLELVRGALAELASIGGIEHLDVQEERRVTRGGAIVRTAVGEIDAQVETKLDRLRAAFASEPAA